MINIFTKQVIRNMERKLDTFHSIVKVCSIKAEYLEEIIARSLVEDEYLSSEGVIVNWVGGIVL